MKNKWIIPIILILVMLALVTKPLSLVGIGSPFTLETSDKVIEIHSSSSYWEKAGCISVEGCDKYNACNKQSIQTDTILGCPIVTCESSGSWQSCTGDIDRCAYGRNCNPSDYLCPRSCKWTSKVLGTQGGVDYAKRNNCAWYMTIKDKQGNIVKEFTAVKEYGSQWAKDNFYRPQVNEVLGETSIKYVSDIYGAVQDGVNDCIAIKFTAQDTRYKYDICLGNDNFKTDKTQALCGSDSVAKTCVLQCNDPTKQLDPDKCECVDKPAQTEPVPDPNTNPVENPGTTPSENPGNTDPGTDNTPTPSGKCNVTCSFFRLIDWFLRLLNLKK